MIIINIYLLIIFFLLSDYLWDYIYKKLDIKEYNE